MAAQKRCIVVCGEEEAATDYETLMKVLTVQSYTEAHGEEQAVRQAIGVWRDQWELTAEQLPALLEVIATMGPAE